MYKGFKLAGIGLLLILLAACGSKKSPTGGPVETDKPTVLTTLPAEFGQITNGRIEINFSKHLDKSTLAQSIYIYPPIQNKKVTADKNTLQIRINEALKPNTNYYVTLSTRLKDVRGNALATNQTLVFAHGELNPGRISGNVIYEDAADLGLPIRLSLLSVDSLMVWDGSVRGPTYAVEALNPASYILRAFIDKNTNGRYDFSREPFFEQSLALSKAANADIHLAYADSTKPVIKSARAKSNREIELQLSEPVASYGAVSINAVRTRQELPVLLSSLVGDRLTLLTEPQDTVSYAVTMVDLRDSKGNTNLVSRIEFRSSSLQDTEPPKVLSSNPRNGTSVGSLQPVLELRFSEIIPRAQLSVQLTSDESKARIPLDVLHSDDSVYRFKPRQPLQNYRSHVLTVTASDISGNKLKEEFKLNFLPLLRSE